MRSLPLPEGTLLLARLSFPQRDGTLMPQYVRSHARLCMLRERRHTAAEAVL